MSDVFLHGLESIFAWMVEASWQASVLAALVLLLQWALRGRLNPRWHHALWLLVVARLILPVQPESALSLFQFAPAPPPAVEQTMTEPIFSSLPQMAEATEPTTPAPLPQYPFSVFTILSFVWLAGALGLLLLTWFVNRRYARHVLTAPVVTDTRLQQLAEAARQEIRIRRCCRMIESGQVQSPAILGLFCPTLILPKDVCSRFNDDELRFIFLHEFAHLKRGDLFLQWLVALLQILHWFNPMLWYAFRRMRADREPATDALVLSCTGEAHKESYGQVLVKLLQHYHQRHSLPTLVGILEDKDQFKRRFSLIARFTRGAYGWSMLGMVILGALAIVGLTKKLPAATTDDDPLIDISSSKLEFKIDPKETKQVEEFQAVLRSPTEKGLNEALQKTHGFLLLGTGHDIQFHLSALAPPKDPNEHKIFRSSTQLHMGEDTVDSKINLHWIDAEHVQINCHLELRDAKNVSLGLLSATWIQPIGKDGVLLLAKNGLTILAPQSDGSQIGCILRFVARANPKVGVSVLAASDQMKDVELLPSGSATPSLPVPINPGQNGTLHSSTEASPPVNAEVAPKSPQVEEHASSGTIHISPLTLHFTLIEVNEEAYAAQKGAMDAAVANSDLEFFKRQKGTYVGPPIEATYNTTKGWYSQGEVQSYVASATYNQPNGKQLVQLTAKAVFLGINADFVFSPSPNATSLHADWQITEPEKAHGTDAPPADTAKSLPNTFSVGPIFHVAKFEDNNWTIVPGKLYAYWLGKTFGQFTRTAGFRDLSHASIDEMAANKVPSRMAVFIQASFSGSVEPHSNSTTEGSDLNRNSVAAQASTSISTTVIPPTFAKAQDADFKVKKYLEVSYVDTADTSAIPGGVTVDWNFAKKLIQNPKNAVTKLVDFPLIAGTNTIKGKIPWGSEFTVTLNWSGSTANKADLSLKMEWVNAYSGNVSYGAQFTAKLASNECYLVRGPWKTKETSNLLLSFVDHPAEQPQRTDANAAPKPDTGASPPPGPTAAEMKAVEDSQTPLIKALLGRQYNQARVLLAQGADCNATDKMGLGPLGALIDKSGDDGRFPMDLLQTILARARDPNPPVPLEFCTPPISTPLIEESLFCATYSNGSDRLGDDRQVVKLLLAHGARFASAPADTQALLQAAALDDLPAMQELVAKGTSPSAADGDGWTPLLVAIALDYDDAANWLIDHGANISAPTRRGAEDPLIFATAHGNDALVEKLIAKGAKPVLRGGDLWRAVDRNDQRLFDDLINAGADPKGESQIHGSAGGQYFRQIESDPLFICIARGQTAMALTLIAKGVDPEPANVFQNRNFAYWAVYHDRPQILQALLDHGANPLLKTDAGETPLSLAQKSHPDLVPLLQAAAQKIAPKSDTGTQPPDATSADETTFYQALERDRTLMADSSVTSSTLAADAQMLRAIQKGDSATLKKVLEHAVDPNKFDPDRFYSCPVYWAVHFNQPEILKLLLEHFATGDIGPAHETPLQLAQRTHPNLVPIIEEGIKRNRAILTARLTEKLHSIHIDLPGFSGAPLSQITKFLLDDATAKAGYLDRRVNIGTMDLPPSTTITSPARPNISVWDALQTIADTNNLKFDVDGSWPGNITLYPPRDEAVIHPPAEKPEDPPPASGKAEASTIMTDVSTSAPWPPSSLSASAGFFPLAATGEVVPPSDTTLNESINNLILGDLDVTNMPMESFLPKLAELLKKNNPDSHQISFYLMVPNEDKPYQVSFHLDQKSNVRSILDQLNARYPIRYEIRGIDDIVVWQVSHFEMAFNKKALETHIHVDLDHATLAEALKAVQTAAAAKGMVFTIANFDNANWFPPNSPLRVTLQKDSIPVDEALRFILGTGHLRLGFEQGKYLVAPEQPDVPMEIATLAIKTN